MAWLRCGRSAWEWEHASSTHITMPCALPSLTTSRARSQPGRSPSGAFASVSATSAAVRQSRAAAKSRAALRPCVMSAMLPRQAYRTTAARREVEDEASAITRWRLGLPEVRVMHVTVPPRTVPVQKGSGRLQKVVPFGVARLGRPPFRKRRRLVRHVPVVPNYCARVRSSPSP